METKFGEEWQWQWQWEAHALFPKLGLHEIHFNLKIL